jgi:hypothetical protein
MRQGVSIREPTYVYLFQNFILIIRKWIWVRYVPYTSLTRKAPIPLGSFPHHLLNRYQHFGGTYCLYRQDGRMVAAVSLKILIPNYQTARIHTLEHLNLHSVPKIGDIKMWLLELNEILMKTFRLKRGWIWLHLKSTANLHTFRRKTASSMNGTNVSVLVHENSLLNPLGRARLIQFSPPNHIISKESNKIPIKKNRI